ncbi:L,D-transpeptidase family protein [Acuticoccus mangrovi]|uniref:Murein L,D-transpeptidase n=1 Tax=Acuticoccus mangrovi TaxID=2796142 RepID=A0A934MET0_9HYPH|nr:murein L,D-transpeptidase family protein [Acuticoccus mangrovi]MBJ3774205.1 murein L,D-transpeptidase [Acuticoccus mangrovi]
MTRYLLRTPSTTATASGLPRPRGGDRLRRLSGTVAALALAGAVLAGCQVSELSTAAHLAPLPAGLERKIDRMDMKVRSPIMLRIYKEESILEVWKEDRTGKFQLLKEYPICAWSGELGPKLKEGDRQAPEGFYLVSRAQMNPNSSYHLSFNLGFPNSFDRSLSRTGSNLMVHGDCSSRGCYAMEDEPVQEIYALAREAFAGGQRAFQVQAFPFRMTPENMARHADSENLQFWEMLKEGSDHFEVTRQPPRIDVCEHRYVFNAAGGSFNASATCPSYTVPTHIARLVEEKRDRDFAKRETVIAQMQNRENREERWAEREKAIASFFNQNRSTGPEADSAAAPAADTAVASVDDAAGTTAAGVPMPRRSPRAAPVEEASSGGFRIPNPFRRNEEPPVASVAAVDETEPAATPAPAAATPAPAAIPTPVVTPSEVPVASTAKPNEPDTEAGDTQVLGFAPAEEESGFFSSIAKGSKGLFRRAGQLFD